MGIPYPNDPGVPANEKGPTLLFPIGHYSASGATVHCNDIVQRSERANHLDGPIPEVGVVVAVQTDDSFSWPNGISKDGAYH